MPTAQAEVFAGAKARVQDHVAGAGARAWDELAGHDRSDVPTFLGRVLPLLEAAQRQTVSMTDGYLAAQLGRPPLGVSATEIIAGIRGDVAPEEVYRRPFVQLWWALSKGQPWEQGSATARARLEATLRTDVALAMTHTMRAVAQADPNIVGFRRVVRGTCDLCEEIAGDMTAGPILQPIHPGCECVGEPLTKPGMSRMAVKPDIGLAERNMDGALGGRGQKAWAGFSEEDRQAMAEYVGTPDSLSINQWLRGQSPDLDLNFKQIVGDMDAVMAKAGPVGRRISVMRGTDFDLNTLGIPGKIEDAVGKAFVDAGYGSTTIKTKLANIYAYSRDTATQFRLQLHPDVRAVWGANPSEGELVLERGCKYVIRSVKRGGPKNQWQVDADVYPPAR